jgi:hypothetical protein
MAHSMTIDSIDLGGIDYGFIIESNDFTTPPDARVNRDAYAMADGESAQGATFGARTGTVSGVVVASSYAGLLVQKENIQRATWLTQSGSKVLTFDAHTGKQWRGRVLSVTYGAETTVTAELSLTLYAPLPWAEASAATEVAGVSIPGSPTTI